MALPPDSLMEFATAPAFAASISETTTRAPSLAKRRAVSAPMPWPEPVIIAVWPTSMPLG